MSKVEKRVDETLGVTRYIFTGKISMDDVFTTLQEFYRHPTKHLIWDVCDADVSTATSADLKKIALLSKSLNTDFANTRLGGKTAILGKSDLQFALARMFTTFTEFENHPIQASAFRDLDSAERWIADSH